MAQPWEAMEAIELCIEKMAKVVESYLYFTTTFKKTKTTPYIEFFGQWKFLEYNNPYSGSWVAKLGCILIVLKASSKRLERVTCSNSSRHVKGQLIYLRWGRLLVWKRLGRCDGISLRNGVKPMISCKLSLHLLWSCCQIYLMKKTTFPVHGLGHINTPHLPPV